MALGNIIITGGASGLGAATVKAVTRHGGTPLVIDRNDPQAGDSPVAFARADLADTEAVDAAVRALAEQVDGQIHGVLTAGGTDVCGKLDDVAVKDWERVIHVNLLGTAAVIRSALPYLKDTGGRIVTCASTLGIKAVSDATAYCASKFGVIGFSRALAAELAGEVGVTTLIPGGMHTAFFDSREEQYKPPPDAKLNQPEHVADTVVFALSQPAGCEVRELVVCASTESSWP
ncbi:SDR family oxidoreductase [Mycolicibacterium celeriflavum]|uniref:Short-chain dehydrogenase n=1 Tax=Mycolicibacterium celeriflavum TaxID=1249101 RepID=A0A1X0BM44_MYCCF|nr:SDR family oxidoreductase [Mycolicibacterium celeriflavum]ORA43839.1 short-chain dehydrogenase [Mycolicibacterium celeriflavum]BBY43768.1 short-chain dehydrogenase [Mycolicibacterium celeriflavum]